MNINLNGENENRTSCGDTAIEIVEKSATNYVDGNSIYILGEFDDTITKNVVPNLVKIINAQKSLKSGKIEFYINSNGGYYSVLTELLSLISMAKGFGVKVITYNMGMAYSCASMLSVVGDERKMFKYAKNLMHLGTTFESNSTVKQLERNNKRQKEHFNDIIALYKEHSKLSEAKIREFMSDDCCFLNANECLRYGLVDEICVC